MKKTEQFSEKMDKAKTWPEMRDLKPELDKLRGTIDYMKHRDAFRVKSEMLLNNFKHQR